MFKLFKRSFLFINFYFTGKNVMFRGLKIYKSSEFLSSSHSLMTTIRSFPSCIILTTYIVSVSGLKLFDAGDDEILNPARRSAPDLIRADGIMRSLRSEPVFEQGIMRKLKRSPYDDFGDKSSMLNNGIMRSLKRSAEPLRNIHGNGLMRSLRSVKKRSLISIPIDENDQDDGKTTYFMDEKNANFKRSALPEEIRSLRSTLIPNHPYDGLTLRYL